MKDLVLRFVIGGLVVSAFALIGDVLKPKSFAGLFGASPSIALATLALTISRQGRQYCAIEARSMMAGAVALFVYAELASCLLLRRKLSALKSSLIALPAWFVVAFAGWFTLLK